MTAIDLSSFFQTKAQASDFSIRIATLSEQIYETNFHLENALLEQFGVKKKDAFLSLLRDNKIAFESNAALKQFFTQIEEQISKIPVLTLTIAFEPKEQTMKALAEWFVLNANQQIVFEINVDPTLIAGASISFNGKDADFSVKTKFEQIVQESLKKSTAPPAPKPVEPNAAV